jgi:hypothetical protein
MYKCAAPQEALKRPRFYVLSRNSMGKACVLRQHSIIHQRKAHLNQEMIQGATDRKGQPVHRNHQMIHLKNRSILYLNVLLVPEEFWGHKANWYGGVQLCYTAHGNEADLDEITSRLADMIKMQLIRMPAAIYPYSRSVDITITDDPGMCGCDECTRQKQVYKDSGLVVKYMNIMSQKYHFDLPKGAGAPVDSAGKQFVKIHGQETLEKLTKWHFANTKKILK